MEDADRGIVEDSPVVLLADTKRVLHPLLFGDIRQGAMEPEELTSLKDRAAGAADQAHLPGTVEKLEFIGIYGPLLCLFNPLLDIVRLIRQEVFLQRLSDHLLRCKPELADHVADIGEDP